MSDRQSVIEWKRLVILVDGERVGIKYHGATGIGYVHCKRLGGEDFKQEPRSVLGDTPAIEIAEKFARGTA